ncbi:MAG: 50S ribosomal protein L9 [Desulfuromonadales bacterium]|nr:50S ribosomal protein L9 [Desulfuromonadales bacterium]
MDIILTENVKGLGAIGEVVKVKPGYGRNYLVPQGLAVEANDRNLNEMEHHKRQLTYKAEKLSKEAADVKARVEAVVCSFELKASDEGKLFGSVTSMEIADSLAAQGVEIDRRKIILDQPIKELGEHEVDIKLNAGVNATIKVNVVRAEA